MATALKPIGHEDRLSLVEHLDELRTRLIVCVLAFSVAFGICLWQNHEVLHIMNRSLEHATAHKKGSKDPFEQSATFDATLKAFAQSEQALANALARDEGVSPATRAAPRPPCAPHPSSRGAGRSRSGSASRSRPR